MVERGILQLSVSALKIRSLLFFFGFFSWLKSLRPGREKKDDSEIVRSWKDVQVLTADKAIRVAASLPIWRAIETSRGVAIASASPTVLWMANAKAVSHFSSTLCVTLSNCSSDVQREVLSNRQRYKLVEGNERAKELSQIIGNRECWEPAWKIKAKMGKIM